jgi:hypothetical protein
MRVEHNGLQPAGFVVKFYLGNGWTFSVRQQWGKSISVMAWPTGTNTSVPGHIFEGRGDCLDPVEDSDIPALMAEVAALPPP